MSESNPHHPGARLLFTLASVVVVIAGLKASGPFLVPVLFALFLSLLCIPPMRRLQSYGVPTGAAIFLVVSVATVLLLLITLVISRSIDQFQDALPSYRQRLDALLRIATSWLQERGIDIDASTISERINTGALMQLVADTARGLLSALSNVFVVILTMIFMLFEANGFAAKLHTVMGKDLGEVTQISQRVNKYLSIKAWISAGTGACVTALTAILGIDFPLLWGLIAFLFNFVPNIGSIIASIPAVMLALIQYGPGSAVLVGIGYAAINLIIGNAIEPKLMGQRVGLSTLVVFLSLLFWGWVWGPVGMLLSVPLTVIVQIILQHYEDFRWLAVLIGQGQPTTASTHDST